MRGTVAATHKEEHFTGGSGRTDPFPPSATNPGLCAAELPDDHLADPFVGLPELLLELTATHMAEQPVQLTDPLDVDPRLDCHYEALVARLMPSR